MSEFLEKYRSLAPWMGMAGALCLNMVAIAYWSGVINQHIFDLERRVSMIERSDQDQTRWLERIAAMESTLSHLRDDLRACKPVLQSGGGR